MLHRKRLATIHQGWVGLSALLLAVLLLAAATAAGSPPVAGPSPANALGLGPDGSPSQQPQPALGGALHLDAEPPSDSPIPTAITLRPGSLQAGQRLAAGLVGLVLAALALGGLTAAVLARRDELARL